MLFFCKGQAYGRKDLILPPLRSIANSFLKDFCHYRSSCWSRCLWASLKSRKGIFILTLIYFEVPWSFESPEGTVRHPHLRSLEVSRISQQACRWPRKGLIAADHLSCLLNIQLQKWSPQAHHPAPVLYKVRGETRMSEHVNCTGMSKPAQSCSQLPGAAEGNANWSQQQLQADSCIVKYGEQTRSQKKMWKERVRSQKRARRRERETCAAWRAVIPGPSNQVHANVQIPVLLLRPLINLSHISPFWLSGPWNPDGCFWHFCSS